MIKKFLIILLMTPLLMGAMSMPKDFSHDIWDSLLKQYVSDKGNVNYKGFKKDKDKLQTYLDLLSKNQPNNQWSRAEVLAYWINAYNAFTVKLIIDHYPLESIKDIVNPWDKKFFTIGTTQMSLGEIEHNILRKMGAPRIHFAINCASISCPNLLNEAYFAPKLESQLATATKNFLKDSTKNTITADKVELSKIFSWFSDDFKTNGTVIDFINKYTAVEIDKKAKIKYKEYNWKLNE